MDDHLKRLLGELSAAIERAQGQDEDTTELRRLVTAVEHQLEGDPAPEDRHHLVDRLREAETRFELDHPVLGTAVRQAIQALTAAGL